MQCHGNGAEHCCWIKGEVCPFLEEGTVPGRRWACGLLREYGTWDDVAASPEWRSSAAAAFFDEFYPGRHCGDWPQNVLDEMSPNCDKCCWETEIAIGDLAT